jgi:hypothetical protein
MLGTAGFLFRSESIISRPAYITQCGNEVAFPFFTMWTLAFLFLRLRQPRPALRRLARQPGMAACSAAALVLVVPLVAIIVPELVSSVRTIGYRATISNALGIERDPPPIPPSAAYGSPYGGLGPGPAYYRNALAPFGPPAGKPPGQFPSVPARPNSSSGSFFDFLTASREVPNDPFPLWYISRRIHRNVVPRAYASAAVAGAWLTLLLAGWWRPERTWIDRFGRAVGAGWIAISLAYHGTSFFF